MFERAYDAEAGFIRVRASGAWVIQEIDDHYAQLKVMVDALRLRNIPIRILVDVREAPDRSAVVDEHIKIGGAAIYRPGDRVAILTHGSSETAVARTHMNGLDKWAWHSELAAEQWLLLDDDHAQM